MAEVGLGRSGSRPRPRAPGSVDILRRLLVAGGLLGSPPAAEELAGEARDLRRAERGRRLALMVKGAAPEDIWADLAEQIQGDFDETLDRLLDALDDPGTAQHQVLVLAARLRGLRDLVAGIDKALALGHGAMQRLAARRLVNPQVAQAPPREGAASG